MHIQTFTLLVALLVVVDARPILLSLPHFIRDDTALSAGSDGADAPAARVDVTLSPDATGPGAATDVSSTADTASVIASGADSAVFPSATGDTDAASSTDSSATDSATDSSLPTDVPSAADTADPVASATDSAATASATDFVGPTTVPISPPACVVKAANLAPPPTDTSTAADPTLSAVPTASTPSSSSNGNAIVPTTAGFPSASEVESATPSATGSASPAAATIPDPFTSSNSTQNVSKRIAQPDLPDVAQAWQDLCLVSGGDIFTNEPCVQLAGIDGINALLATSDPCAQQDNADAMIDFAKSPGVTNADALIQNAVAFRKHPRNALNVLGVIPSTPFCQKTPRNQELVGVVNDQLPGVDLGIFGGPEFGLIAFGEDGTCPFGTTPDVNSCSCVQSGNKAN